LLSDIFLFAFVFRSINPKTQKYFAAIYFPLVCFPLSIAILILQPYRQGIDNPLFALGARICYFCAGAAYWVLGDSSSGSITLVS
jgi:hypothetical protein